MDSVRTPSRLRLDYVRTTSKRRYVLSRWWERYRPPCRLDSVSTTSRLRPTGTPAFFLSTGRRGGGGPGVAWPLLASRARAWWAWHGRCWQAGRVPAGPGMAAALALAPALVPEGVGKSKRRSRPSVGGASFPAGRAGKPRARPPPALSACEGLFGVRGSLACKVWMRPGRAFTRLACPSNQGAAAARPVPPLSGRRPPAPAAGPAHPPCQAQPARALQGSNGHARPTRHAPCKEATAMPRQAPRPRAARPPKCE